jgi:hypothetical protein
MEHGSEELAELRKEVWSVLAIPSFFEIKESGGVRTLSEKNLIVIF